MLDVDKEGRYDLSLGQQSEIILQVNVTNKRESAYEAELFIVHSLALSYIALDKLVGHNIPDFCILLFNVKCVF